MSAFICDNETITCIARAFIDYGVEFRGGRPKTWVEQICIDVQEETKRIGQALLEANYKSVNFRYNEDTEVPEFEPAELKDGFDEGVVIGCIACYDYQSCEVNDWEETLIYKDLQRLKDKILKRLVNRCGMTMTYGYDGFDMED